MPKPPQNVHIDIFSAVICLDFGLSPHQHVYEKRGCYGESEPLSIFVRAFCCSNSLAIIKGLFARLKMSPLRVKGSFTHLSGELSPTAAHDRYANSIFRCDYGTL